MSNWNLITNRIAPTRGIYFFLVMACNICLFTSAMAKDPLNTTPNKISSEDKTPKSLEDLDSETRRRYQDARAKLQQAEEEHAKAVRDIDSINPTLASARILEKKTRELGLEVQKNIKSVEQRYRSKGAEALAQFNAWRDCYEQQLARIRLEEMSKDADKRPIIVWFVKSQLDRMSKAASGFPAQVRQLIPANTDGLSDDKAIEVFFSITDQISNMTDCSKLEKAIAPSKADRDAVIGNINYKNDLEMYSTYVSTQSKSEKIVNAEKLRREAANEVYAIWPHWSDYELGQAQKQKEKKVEEARTENLRSQRSMSNQIMLYLSALVFVVLLIFFLFKKFKSG